MRGQKLIFVALAVTAMASTASANDRLTDAQYDDAERCAAYQAAMPGPGVDVDALTQDLRIQRRQRPEHLREAAAIDARAIARAARRLDDDAARAIFAADRDVACGAVETWAAAVTSRG